MNSESPAQSCNSIVTIGPGNTGILPNGTYPYRTGDFPGYGQPYTGDPIEPSVSPIQIIPGKVDVFPLGPTYVPDTHWIQSSGISLTPHPWKVTVTADGLCCRCDVPGAKVEDVSVMINNGTITVSYKRFDTGGMCYPATQFVGADYDPTTTEASLECGVLTINIKRFPVKAGIKVTVTGK